MDKGLIFKRFDNKLNLEYIKTVIKDFEMIREKIYLDGNPTEVVSQYLHLQSHINGLREEIKNINSQIKNMELRMKGVKNQSINQLRKENRLMSWLNNLTTDELSRLKEVVNIEREFRAIDDQRFRNRKANNGNKVIFKM